jgi:hypothetical protein|tara:strand:+ start:587 stop:2944 length:2358 start_codon:yes stop_codon:yes gene_type:complete
MAINAVRPRATTDGSQQGIVDTTMPVTTGDMLVYDSLKNMYVPSTTSALTLGSFNNDLGFLSLAEVNAAIDANAVASVGGVIDLAAYIKTVEVEALFTAYVPPLVDYANILNTPSLTPYATSVYVDQQIAAVDVFSGDYTDLINKPSLFSGDYADLTSQPIIPSIDGLASIAYVDQQIAAVVHPATDLSAHALISSLPTDINDLTDTDSLLVTDLTEYSTITYVDQQIANVSAGNLSEFITTSSLATSLAAYTLTTALFSGSYDDLTNKPVDLVTTGYLTNTLASYQPITDLSVYALTTSLFSGDYADLTNTPTLFSGEFADLINTPTIFSGSYTDLTNQPIIPSIAGLATIASLPTDVSDLTDTTSLLGSGGTTNYNNLTNKPTIPTDVSDLTDTTSLLGGGGGTTNYNDLINTPTIPSITGLASEAYVTNAISVADFGTLSSTSDLNDVAISGVSTNHILMYNALSSMWENIDLGVSWASKDYVTAQLVGLQTDGVIDLEGYASESFVIQKLVERGDHFSANYNDLVNRPALFSGNYNDLSNIPASSLPNLSFILTQNVLSLNNGNEIDLSTLALDYSTLVNSPAVFSGSYSDLSNAPVLFSGNYLDLANKPYIPSVAGLATESYVNNKHAEPDVIGDRNFTNNVEFRADIKQVVSGVSTTAQRRDLVFATETTDAVETEVSFSDSTYVTLADNTTAKFSATYVATSGTAHDSFKVTGIVHKMSGTMVAIGNNSYEVTQDSSSGCTGFVSVDVANDRIKVSVQGPAATSTDWVVFLELIEVTR